MKSLRGEPPEPGSPRPMPPCFPRRSARRRRHPPSEPGKVPGSARWGAQSPARGGGRGEAPWGHRCGRRGPLPHRPQCKKRLPCIQSTSPLFRFEAVSPRPVSADPFGGTPPKILSWISQRHGLSQAYPESQKGAFKTKSSSAAGAWGAQLTQLQGFPKLQRHCAILPLRDFTCLPCSLKAFVMHSCSLTFVGGVEVKHSISFRASEDLPEPLCWSFCSAAFLVATHLMCGFVPLMQVDLHISCFQEPDYDRYGAEGWFIPILTHYGSLNWNVKGWRA